MSLDNNWILNKSEKVMHVHVHLHWDRQRERGRKKHAVIVCKFLQMFIHFLWLKLYLVCDQKQLSKGLCFFQSVPSISESIRRQAREDFWMETLLTVVVIQTAVGNFSMWLLGWDFCLWFWLITFLCSLSLWQTASNEKSTAVIQKHAHILSHHNLQLLAGIVVLGGLHRMQQSHHQKRLVAILSRNRPSNTTRPSICKAKLSLCRAV